MDSLRRSRGASCWASSRRSLTSAVLLGRGVAWRGSGAATCAQHPRVFHAHVRHGAAPGPPQRFVLTAAAAEGAEDAAALRAPQGSLAHLWPDVDWHRYHLQILFVDETDTLRARLAAGLFERTAEWNGYGRALYPWTCGLHVGGPRSIDGVDKLAAISAGAAALQLSLRSFTRPAEAFELDDLYRYDLVMALDSHILAEIQQLIKAELPPGPDRDAYMAKVCLLTTFSQYESDACLSRKGGFALLPTNLHPRIMAGGGLQASKAVRDIPSPDLSSPDGSHQWDVTVASLLVCCASLCKYLMDSVPGNMPHWDPDD